MKPLNDRDFKLFVESAEKLVEPGQEARAQVVHALALVTGQATAPTPSEPHCPRPLQPILDLLDFAERRGIKLKRIERDPVSGMWRIVWDHAGFESCLGEDRWFEELIWREVGRVTANFPEVRT